jgi:N-acylglucosamine-6-phosphate 2-epimerase
MTCWAALADALRGRLVVSCQAPEGSPLRDPYVIARFACAAEGGGAAAVRVDTPAHVRAVRECCRVPIIGLFKQVHPGSDVYIPPTTDAAVAVAHAGADVIALDATHRARPGGQRLATIVDALRDLGDVVLLADVATRDEGLAAIDLGFDLLATTLSGYTADAPAIDGPDLDLVAALAHQTHVPVMCEGRVRTPQDVRRAFDAGAFAVVVGGAITGVDDLVRAFVQATPGRSGTRDA